MTANENCEVWQCDNVFFFKLIDFLMSLLKVHLREFILDHHCIMLIVEWNISIAGIFSFEINAATYSKHVNSRCYGSNKLQI